MPRRKSITLQRTELMRFVIDSLCQHSSNGGAISSLKMRFPYQVSHHHKSDILRAPGYFDDPPRDGRAIIVDFGFGSCGVLNQHMTAAWSQCH